MHQIYWTKQSNKYLFFISGHLVSFSVRWLWCSPPKGGYPPNPDGFVFQGRRVSFLGYRVGCQKGGPAGNYIKLAGVLPSLFIIGDKARDKGNRLRDKATNFLPLSRSRSLSLSHTHTHSHRSITCDRYVYIYIYIYIYIYMYIYIYIYRVAYLIGGPLQVIWMTFLRGPASPALRWLASNLGQSWPNCLVSHGVRGVWGSCLTLKEGTMMSAAICLKFVGVTVFDINFW